MATPQKGDINPATGKQYAVNPATGNWDDTYWAEVVEPRLKAQSGGGGGGISYNAPPAIDYEAITKRAIELQQQAAQPAISSFQAQIPETQARFGAERTRLEAEKEPLTKRYENLLSEVTGRQQQEEQRTGIATSQELGRRGISAEGGLYAQEVNRALQPITQFYTGQAKELGLSQEDALRNLQNLISGIPQQETEALRQIQNAIAALQGGAGQAGISSALQQAQLQQRENQETALQQLNAQIASAQQTYQQQQLGFQQTEAEKKRAEEQAQLAWQQPWQEKLWSYELGKPYYKPETGGETIDFTDLFNQFNTQQQGQTNWENYFNYGILPK